MLLQLLPGQKSGLRLPRTSGNSGHKDQSDLGQSYTSTWYAQPWVSHNFHLLNKVARQIWCRESEFLSQSSSQIIRRLGQSDAVSVIDLALHQVTKMDLDRHCGACCWPD